jgi:type IV protein arginine methyltransferase
MNQDYLNQRLTYTDDGKLLDADGHAVMMDWEDELMRVGAETICRNGGDILNVGFGMGIIDTYIESHRPRTHWIIEGHPDVQQKIIMDGWLKKPHVKVIFKPWQEVIYNLPKFDGIYFDTWNESQEEFDMMVPQLLKPDGVYSFFNNPRGDEHQLHVAIETFRVLNHYMQFDVHPIPIPHIDSVEEQRTDGNYYWHPENKIYWNVAGTLRKEYR